MPDTLFTRKHKQYFFVIRIYKIYYKRSLLKSGARASVVSLTQLVEAKTEDIRNIVENAENEILERLPKY